jgi:hypothetical protein
MTSNNNKIKQKKQVPDLQAEVFEGRIQIPAIEGNQNWQSFNYEKVFIPNWKNAPEELTPIVTLNSTSILTFQNITAIISSPGTGKSSIIEAIGASYLNRRADCLGFEIDQACKGVIIIDNERTNYDVWCSFFRMCQRAKIPNGGATKNVKIAGLRNIPSLTDRLFAIEDLLNNNPCNLLLIDGAGDLVADINDAKQSTECRTWLRALTATFNLSVIVTLHPNPGTKKPRGHLGSEICREAESVLILKPYDKQSRIITSDFEYGKNRNGPNANAAFRWSEGEGMFMSVDYDTIAKAKKSAKADAEKGDLITLAQKLIHDINPVRNSWLVDEIIKITSESEPTAKRKIKRMLDLGILQKNEIGRYIINPDYSDN